MFTMYNIVLVWGTTIFISPVTNQSNKVISVNYYFSS